MNFGELEEKKKRNSLRAKIALVVLVVLLLVTLVAVSLLNARRVSRDVARLAAVISIRSGLEMYFLDNIRYPSVIDESCSKNGLSGCCLDKKGISRKCSGKTYVDYIVADPSGDGKGFFYSPTENSQSYILTYNLEGNNGYLTPGFHKATPFSVGE